MEREINAPEKDRNDVEEAKVLQQEEKMPIGEEHLQMQKVVGEEIYERENSTNGEIRTDGHGGFALTKALKLN